MSVSADTTLVGDLVAVLEEAQALLSAARAPEAAALMDRKLAAMQALEEQLRQMLPLPASHRLRDSIVRIQRLAEENARFLETLRFGLQSAIARIEGMNSSAYVGSYGRGGAQMAFSLATGGYNTKA